jgi:hypothetical protein
MHFAPFQRGRGYRPINVAERRRLAAIRIGKSKSESSGEDRPFHVKVEAHIVPALIVEVEAAVNRGAS